MKARSNRVHSFIAFALVALFGFAAIVAFLLK